MKKMFPIALIWLLPTILWAQHSGAGTILFPNVNMNFDAQSAAMAGASVALPNGAYGMISNPASIGFSANSEIIVGYQYILDGVWGGPFALVYPFGKYGVVGVGLIGITSGDIQVIKEDVNGNPLQTGEKAGAKYITTSLSYGYKFNNGISLGLNAKGLFNSISVPDYYYWVDGVALDCGIQYEILNGRFISGLVFRNVGFLYHSYSESNKYKLPLTFEAGVSYVPGNIPSLRVAFDINKKTGDYVNFEPGLEFDIYKKHLLARLGYAFSEQDVKQLFKNDDQYVKSNWTSFCLGVGLFSNINQIDVNIDIAVQFRSTDIPPGFIVSAKIDI